MTTKLEYLKKAVTSVSSKPMERKDWFYYALSILVLKDEDITDKKHLDLLVKQDGLYYVNVTEDGSSEAVKIVDYDKSKPLFSISDVISIDSSWLPSVTGKLETTLGRLIVNKLVLADVVGGLVPYINSKFSVSDIETIFSYKVKNDEDMKAGDISVKQMNVCIDRLTFLNNLGPLIAVAATYKTITAPPDLEKRKAAILKKYEGQLGDPVKAVEFEEELSAIDKEYLADDPDSNKIFSRKSKAGRKKMLLTVGNTNDFTATGKGTFIAKSLDQGVSTDKDEFAAHINDIRFSSYSRGASTARGGYAYKQLQRGLGGVEIDQTPCSTTRGFVRLIAKSNYKTLVNRYVKSKSGWVVVSDIPEAEKYIDKQVEIRSPMYCKTPDNKVCYACMGANYKGSPSGISNLISGISTVMLKIGLKAMHASVTETAEVTINDLCG